MSKISKCTFANAQWPGTRIGKFSQVFPSLFLFIRVLTSHNFRVESVAWSPNGKKIASCSHDSTIKIWDSQSGDCHSTLTGHSNSYVFFFSNYFPSLLLLICVLTSYNFSVYSVAWSPDGKQFASGSSDKTIKIWDSQSGDCLSTLTGHRWTPLPGSLY